MKTWTKAALCISLSFMCLLCCIGYAVLSENLKISGAVIGEPLEPEGLYISKVEEYSSTGVSYSKEKVILPTNLISEINVTAQNASITYKITVHNKTDMTYWYLGQVADPAVNSNNLINTTGGIIVTTKDGSASNSTLFDSSDWIPPHTERDFYATYVFGANAQGSISTMINFSFGLHMASVSDAFLKVLNDKSFGYPYLVGAFEENYVESKSTVIANIGDDEEVFNTLFGSSLTVNMNGEDLPVTIVVERANVDRRDGTNGTPITGDTYAANSSLKGCEYTVYITVDDLDNGNTATVYAVSYTCGSDGVWYMIGELYKGTCNVETYENDNSVKAFDVDSWRATQSEYKIIGSLTYKAGYPNGETYDKYLLIEDLMSEFDQSFCNRINNTPSAIDLLTRTARILYTYKNNSGRQEETQNTANIANPGYAELKIAFDKLKPYCNLDNFYNSGSRTQIKNEVSVLSRAELIRILEDIQSAYDYYVAINSNN